MNSFLLVLTQSGMILYTSESVTSLLNYLPVSLSYSHIEIIRLLWGDWHINQEIVKIQQEV